ncbi:hypothetical protein CKM354_001261900 [Cercospora kikuchii]|uniref:Uncharacterized protein n=1 Tax=Cercospora kikuchii TaxID=84275 RepID=A0A9P3FMB3_9PEZI|nr:uncharacterized protein CKM354_001261900 [Cercospora kikuchii]GIZ49589.1 hypothetical protein CKM354_001261900 [Cercospora kikuchii]
MLPRALTWREASRLYHENRELEDDELIQVAEWFSNNELAARINRSPLNRPAGQSPLTGDRIGNTAGGRLNTALEKRARALDIKNKKDMDEFKGLFRARRDANKDATKSGLLPTADQVVAQPNRSIVRSRKRAQSDDEYEVSPQASRKKRKTRAQAQTAQPRVDELVPQLARNDIGSKKTTGPEFGSMVVSSIAGFCLDERENRNRLKWLNPRWLKLITRGETELTAEYLISFFEPDVSVDNLKDVLDQVPKKGQHAARILWLMTVYTWLLGLPDNTIRDTTTDDFPLIDRLQRVTELFNDRFGSLSLVHLPDSVGPEWSLIYGIHILSHLCPGRSCHVLLAEFVFRYLGHFSAEKLALGDFLHRRDLQHCTLPGNETDVISFMASVTRSAMEIWLKSPQIFDERVPLFESIVFIAGTRFDPPLFQVDSEEDEED